TQRANGKSRFETNADSEETENIGNASCVRAITRERLVAYSPTVWTGLERVNHHLGHGQSPPTGPSPGTHTDTTTASKGPEDASVTKEMKNLPFRVKRVADEVQRTGLLRTSGFTLVI
uniref:Uncharacterized protein n=1 Tax=Strigamia maritima TaxID=126957 RepID=T1IQN7_STRMM